MSNYGKVYTVIVEWRAPRKKLIHYVAVEIKNVADAREAGDNAALWCIWDRQGYAASKLVIEGRISDMQLSGVVQDGQRHEQVTWMGDIVRRPVDI